MLIEATVAEVTLTNDLRFGLQWFFNTADLGLGAAGTGTLSSGTAGQLLPRFPGFSFVAVEAQAARLVLDTLDEVTNVDVISSPMLMVLDNQFGELQVDNQVPVATQQATQTSDADAPLVNTVAFRDTGVILRVTPRVNASGALTLDIEQEVSSVTPTPGAGTLTPTISQRRIKSSVLVHSGETVVLGGLISDQSQLARSGLPYLSRVPVLGGLFGRHEEGSAKTELAGHDHADGDHQPR
ncbi:MAG: hypothetical protein MI920_00355 [Kiloniellales bacterium]|nr:hypothetical protein [Kiloniellales bacterium]